MRPPLPSAGDHACCAAAAMAAAPWQAQSAHVAILSTGSSNAQHTAPRSALSSAGHHGVGGGRPAARCPRLPQIFFYFGNEDYVDLYVNHTGLMWENAAEFGAMLPEAKRMLREMAKLKSAGAANAADALAALERIERIDFPP